jgi:hypothetical protein
MDVEDYDDYGDVYIWATWKAAGYPPPSRCRGTRYIPCRMNKLWAFPSIKFVFLKGLSLYSSFQRICHPGRRACGAIRPGLLRCRSRLDVGPRIPEMKKPPQWWLVGVRFLWMEVSLFLE